MRVSAREKLPWMPWPCLKNVSATNAPQVVGSAQPVEKERKLTTIAGLGVSALPSSPIADIGRVPGMRPSASATKRPLV